MTSEQPRIGLSRFKTWVLLLLSGLFTVPALFVGFSHDDLVHRLRLEHRIPEFSDTWWSLYDFTPPGSPASLLTEHGILPWFTNPELSLRFLRPVSSLTLALDHACFGRHALPPHLHSLVWQLLLTLIAGKLYARWFSPRAAWLSALVFALSGVHAVPTAWLASRHTLVAAVFGSAALLAWARFREESWRPGRWLGPLLLTLALLSSESALAAVVLLCGYELGTRSLRQGFRGAAPHWLLGVAYLAIYAALGYGARGSTFYVSPFDSPVRYLTTALLGVPALSVELLLGLPSAVAGLVDGAQAAFVVLGVAALSGCAWLLYVLRHEQSASTRKTLLWLGLATFVGLWALVGALATGRVLPLPMVGAAAVLGNAMAAAWAKVREPSREKPLRKRWLLALGVLALASFVVSPLMRVGGALQFRSFVTAQRELAKSAELGACSERGFAYLLTAADPILALSAAATLFFYTPEKAHFERFRVLSMAPQAERLSRVAKNAFELRVLDLPRRSNAFESLFRAPGDPLAAGQDFRSGELHITVLEATAGVFTKARFELNRDLEAGPVCFLVWKGGRLSHLPLPAVGQSQTIAHEPGPMGM